MSMASAVTRIVAHGGGGNDRIEIGDGISAVLDIDGGDHDDIITVGLTARTPELMPVTIHGGDGNDQITTLDTTDLVYGGRGDDVRELNERAFDLCRAALQRGTPDRPRWIAGAVSNYRSGVDRSALDQGDRLHASFAEMPEPAAPKEIELEAPDEDGEIDPLSPLGFAHRAGAKSLPELMTAAAAYLNIAEGRTSVSRNDMVDVVSAIAPDTPLTAEAKVKAVGKLVRAGTLVRLEGGQFMLDDVAVQTYRDKLDGAA